MSGYANDAKEVRGTCFDLTLQVLNLFHNLQFLRKKLIGKTVRVKVDFIRPAEGDFEERECATVKYGGANACVLVFS